MDIESLRRMMRGEGKPEGEKLKALLPRRRDHRPIARPTRMVHKAFFRSPIVCTGHLGLCGNTPTATIHAMTAYPNPEDNKDVQLCEKCAEDYTNDWQDQWDEYHRGLL